ncbi:MAG TPA: pyridoxal-phosphate dependent enzyme, partial [Candidatus Eremiobacteraceae bacterium]|nr:pyridoxal-phosphate dependent enzyme [Candidatus Eremiobacteraceae bacterium]
RILNESRGAAIAVNDDEILEYQRQLIDQEGVLACPEGGATLAAVAQLRRDEIIREHERVLIINTGSGALYPDIVCPPLETIGADGELRITFND